MIERWKAFSLISNWDNCQRYSLLRISAASRTWTCAEPEFRLISIKLGSSDNHHTTAPPAISGMGLLSSLCISPFWNSVTAFRNAFASDRSDCDRFFISTSILFFSISSFQVTSTISLQNYFLPHISPWCVIKGFSYLKKKKCFVLEISTFSIYISKSVVIRHHKHCLLES